jgi:hypothetical protein
MAERRDRVLTTLAVLMALLAVSDLFKPIGQAAQPGGSAGLVFFGTRLHGLANAILGPLFGLFLAVYAWALWNRRRIAVPIAVAYGAYAGEPRPLRVAPGAGFRRPALRRGLCAGGDRRVGRWRALSPHAPRRAPLRRVQENHAGARPG